jgi:hypothetical protein
MAKEEEAAFEIVAAIDDIPGGSHVEVRCLHAAGSSAVVDFFNQKM